jgi:hypothetical protein
VRRLLLFAVLGLLTAPRPAGAVDEFEIQVYDAETAPPDTTGFELHLNHIFVDGPAAGGQASGVSHFTLEPHVGVLRWLEAGMYLQTALLDDGRFAFGGVKLRAKARVPHRLRGVVGLALNVEVSGVPREFEPNRFGSELRPILDVRWRRLYASVNPILSIDLAGPQAGHPQLEPAATVVVSVAEPVDLGVEYYGGFGPLDAPFPTSLQTHRLFAVTNVAHNRFALNFGVGYGFTGPEKWLLKSILTLDLP